MWEPGRGQRCILGVQGMSPPRGRGQPMDHLLFLTQGMPQTMAQGREEVPRPPHSMWCQRPEWPQDPNHPLQQISTCSSACSHNQQLFRLLSTPLPAPLPRPTHRRAWPQVTLVSIWLDFRVFPLPPQVLPGSSGREFALRALHQQEGEHPSHVL